MEKRITEDPLLMGMFVVAMSTGSADEAVDTMQKMAASQTINNELLPMDCNLNKVAMEQLGFVFINEYDKYLWNASLPEGWRLEHTNAMHFSLFDQNNGYRGHVMNDMRPWDRAACMTFYPRYRFESYYPENSSGVSGYCIKDNKKNSYLFISELINWREVGYEVQDEHRKKYEEKYIKYLEENYPDYKNVLAYWEDE